MRSTLRAVPANWTCPLFRPKLSLVRGEDRHTAGTQDAENLLVGNGRRIADHQQVHQVVGVRQLRTAQTIHGHGAVDPGFTETLTGLLDLGRVGIEAVNQIAAAGPQGFRQPAVAATEVNHQSSMHAGRLENRS